jgi:hypothetical protein
MKSILKAMDSRCNRPDTDVSAEIRNLASFINGLAGELDNNLLLDLVKEVIIHFDSLEKSKYFLYWLEYGRGFS